MPPHDPKPDLHLEQEEAAAAAAVTATATTEGLTAAAAASETAAGAVDVPPSRSTPACKPTACTCCGDGFPTRSALFRHLRNPPEHCSATRQDTGEKVLLLFGYDCSPRGKSDTASAGILQGPLAATRVVAGGDSAAGLVLEALGVGGAEDPLARPAGFSQGSSVGSRSCPLLVQEAGVSATADTACLRAPTTVPLEGIHSWLKETNALLDGTGVRLLGRMQVMLPTFHAEIHASRRRYEYLLPAWLLDETAEGPWAGPARGQESLIPLLKQLRGRALRPFGHCNGSGSGKRRRCPIWHNFSDSAVPHSPSAARRLYRFYASEVVELRGADYLCLSVSGDAFVSQQVRGMVGLAVAAARGLISGTDIAACIDPSRREDLLPLPLAPVAPCSLAEIGYPSWQTKLGGYCMSPGADERASPPLEGWSDAAARSDAASFRHRVLDNAAGWWEDRRRGADWLRDVLQPGAVKLRREIDDANERKIRVGAASDEVEPLPVDAMLILKEAPAAFANVLRWLREADASGRWPDSTPSRSLVISGGKEGAPGGKSGKSNKNANGRGRGQAGGGGKERGKRKGRGPRAAEAAFWEKTKDVEMEEAPQQQQEQQQQEKEKEEEEQQEQQQEQQQEEQPQPQQQKQEQQRGGSFTVGAFPPPCPPPRGNRLFPELARAAFELEAILLPDRPPSTTIAVNRHAKFRPHVDSGAGAGQSRSLIVGLGDYVGGELVVEGEAEDIRYRPLEFNGWTQRHWTRPFKGERYSLVWFTPKGCEGISGDDRFSVPVGDAGEVSGGMS